MELKLNLELESISQISKQFNISTRTLRYYEQIGLINPVETVDFSYRMYDANTITRLKQIIILRKLRIPLKQIADILKNGETAFAIEIFQQKLNETEDEITALSVIKSIIQSFISKLNIDNRELQLLDDESLLEIVDSLTVSKINFKFNEEKSKSMEELNKASEEMNKLKDKDVRIIYLPPATVAAAYAKGTEPGPELVTAEMVDKFIKESDLKNIYPASRHFGFNNPDEPVHGEGHGYERYITIPDDMEIPAPLVKKHFIGGIYASRTITMGEWDEWMKLHEWVGNNDRYDFNWGTIDGVCGWIEEHLNYWNWYTCGLSMGEVDGSRQIDLMIPVKPRFAATTKHPQERIIDTFKYNDMPIEIAEWDDIILCGKIGYAENNTSEPDMGRISDGFLAQNHAAINGRLETTANALFHFDFLTSERPAAAMFAFIVDWENQPDGFDVKKVPAGQYMRLALVDESAKALGVEPWNGGAPPIEWISERLAPQFGYRQVFDLPFIEYYGLNDSTNVANAFLYVPVEKII